MPFPAVTAVSTLEFFLRYALQKVAIIFAKRVSIRLPLWFSTHIQQVKMLGNRPYFHEMLKKWPFSVKMFPQIRPKQARYLMNHFICIAPFLVSWLRNLLRL